MLDLTKDRAKLLELYQPGTETFVIVDVPELPFAVIAGNGPPDLDVGDAIKTLFTAIYPIRRRARELMGKHFVEPPPEILYWADDMHDLATGKKENWKWKVMVTLPVWIDEQAFSESLKGAQKHLGEISETLTLEMFAEGRCAQIMHIGEHEKIPEILTMLYNDFLPKNGLEPNGPYHEIYLDDWSRIAPQKRKIILRQPVRSRR